MVPRRASTRGLAIFRPRPVSCRSAGFSRPVASIRRNRECHGRDGDAAELAARFGIDIRAPELWSASLDVIRADVDRFEALMADGQIAVGAPPSAHIVVVAGGHCEG